MSYSYDVQTRLGKDWRAVQSFQSRTSALVRANAMIDSKESKAVRVVHIRRRPNDTVKEKTIFEQVVPEQKEKPIAAQSVDEAAYCEEAGDIFRLDARVTISKVMSKYFERKLITACELVTDPGNLMMLASDKPLLKQAFTFAGVVQAKSRGEDQQKRIAELSELFKKVLKLSETVAEGLEPYNEIRDTQGLDAALEAVEQLEEPKRRGTMLALIGDRLRDEGDPALKVKTVLEFLNGPTPATSDSSLELIDNVIAEMLSSTDTLRVLLGRRTDLGEALSTAASIASGKWQPDRSASAALTQLSEALSRHRFQLSKQALNRWVAMGLDSTTPLTREGQPAERQTFARVLNGMLGNAGVYGGSESARCLTQRARGALASNPDDQMLEPAIERLADMIEEPAARIGYLLDLSASSIINQGNAVTVLRKLAKTLNSIRTLGDFVPSAKDEEETALVRNIVLGKIAASTLPAEVLQGMESRIKSLKSGASKSSQPAPADSEASSEQEADVGSDSQEPAKPAEQKPKSNLRVFAAGDIIYTPKDDANEAYIIRSGAVKIIQPGVAGEEQERSLGPSDVLGEMCLAGVLTRQATAIATKDTELVVVPKTAFAKRLKGIAEKDRMMAILLNAILKEMRRMGE